MAVSFGCYATLVLQAIWNFGQYFCSLHILLWLVLVIFILVYRSRLPFPISDKVCWFLGFMMLRLCWFYLLLFCGRFVLKLSAVCKGASHMQEFLSKDCLCLHGWPLQRICVCAVQISCLHVHSACSDKLVALYEVTGPECSMPPGLVSAHRRSLVVAKGGHGPHGYANFPLGV